MKIFLILAAPVVAVVVYLSLARPAAEEKTRRVFESLGTDAMSKSYGFGASGNEAAASGKAAYATRNAVPNLDKIRTSLAKEGWKTVREKEDQDGNTVLARGSGYEIRVSTKGRHLYFESVAME